MERVIISSQKNVTRFILSEYFIWLVLAGLVSGRFLITIIGAEPRYYEEIISTYYFELLIGIIIAIFPLLFLQIFGNTPLQAYRQKKSTPYKNKVAKRVDANVENIQSDSDSIKDEVAFDSEISAYLHRLTRDSEELSKRIYSRSGVYLIFGVLIAFSGIFYFSFQSISVSGEKDIGTLLIALAPRFGILFFIEFIAFFFLKQYRAAMDEFRHYEGVKRVRESQLAIFLMATEKFSEKDFAKVVERINFFENVGRLSDGETTELIELSKQNNNELETLKIVVQDLIKVGKSNAQK